VLQKERALFRKEEREARQVDLPVVYLGFGEVSVEGRRPFEVRCDVEKDISAGFARKRVVASCVVPRPFRTEIRANIQPAALLDFLEAFNLAGFGNLKEAHVETRRGPAVFFDLAFDSTRKIEAPRRLAFVEAKTLERNL